MHDQIALRIYADDPVSKSGIAAALAERSGLTIVNGDGSTADVVIVAADSVDDDTLRLLRTVQRNDCQRVVLVATRIDDRGLLGAIEAGASGILRRSEATPEALGAAVNAAHAGDGTIPNDLLGRLLHQIGRLQRQVLRPHGLTLSGLTEREIGVLRLIADGLDTGEIARKLSYSERTIKNVIHDVTTRLQMRNRAQAVAYAVREGLI